MTKFDKILYIEIGKILKKARLQKNMSLQREPHDKMIATIDALREKERL